MKKINVDTNIFANKEVSYLCDQWLLYIKEEQLLSLNTYQAYAIDLKYFLILYKTIMAIKLLFKI